MTGDRALLGGSCLEPTVPGAFGESEAGADETLTWATFVPMDLGAVEENVAGLDVLQGFDLIFDLLLAYGMPRASVARLRKGSLNQSDLENEVLWKTKVYYRFISDEA